jgi:hypothetical protein
MQNHLWPGVVCRPHNARLKGHNFFEMLVNGSQHWCLVDSDLCSLGRAEITLYYSDGP